MSTYAIGDIQGCHEAFVALLERMSFDRSSDRLWIVGDVVNRGPDSLAMLRHLARLDDAATVVLGNHDLHLLAVSAGVRAAGRNDTLDEIFDAADATALLDWLRHRPLAHRERIDGDGSLDDRLMVHAGLLPSWDADDAMARAAELEAVLRHDDWKSTLGRLFGSRPDRWDDALEGDDRLRVIVNTLTRLRFCTADDRIDFESKDAPGAASGAFPQPPRGFLPWFDVPGRASRDTCIVCGHWSTLGVVVRDDLIALDSGCVWGGCLTAVRLEDRARFQVRCPQVLRPG